MNVPARYCTGYLGDMGTEPPYGPGDFAAWFEAYLGGRWHIFDPRNNVLEGRFTEQARAVAFNTFELPRLARRKSKGGHQITAAPGRPRCLPQAAPVQMRAASCGSSRQ